MRYMGSKARLAKHILPIMLVDRGDRLWVEPFVGGANMIDKVEGRRIGCDINEYVIAMLDAASKGWMPKESYLLEEYTQTRINKDADPISTGWLGTACSFGGKFFGGYARSEGGNPSGEQYRYALTQFPKLKGVEFVHQDYRSLRLEEPALIYCDPPYAGVSEYTHKGFNHVEFHEWCVEQAHAGHIVYVSEYEINHPRFKCVFEKEQASYVRRADRSTRTERLYKVVRHYE